MKASSKVFNPLMAFEHKRDAYGFAVRPQHLERYREYANIYKEEEEERSDRWESFLERQAKSAELPVTGVSTEVEDDTKVLHTEVTGELNEIIEKGAEGDTLSGKKFGSGISSISGRQEEISSTAGKSTLRVQLWTHIRPSLHSIENMMSARVKKKKSKLPKYEEDTGTGELLPPIEEARSPKGAPEEESEDEFYDVERSDPIQYVPSSETTNASVSSGDEVPLEFSFPWKDELDVLVRGGVPMALRGELWQAFVGVRARHVEKYYQDLLASETKYMEQHNLDLGSNNKVPITDFAPVPEKWKGQIEKDLPRTFPGHPALDEDGRNALRRLLTAYARHNPSVGYCQAMNFFAGLLLLLMSEENAFWTLVGILDDYFDGYYSEDMVDYQVDQLVFEELVLERFPKLVNHLEYLGVQIAWVIGPWFISIFMNMLPWESVLRVWDVLLFEGNRVMLFRTALALMELYGPALITTKDAGDAVTLFQSLAGSTFDVSQLVLTASMGYQNVTEARLQELRNKHRPAVIALIEERAKGLQTWKNSQGLVSKLYSFKHEPKLLMIDTSKAERLVDTQTNGNLCRSDSESTNVDEYLVSLSGNGDADSAPDLQDQVLWLKVELCRLLEEKRSSILRAEELETALMEMVQHDNRRQLSARVEQLEQEVADLRRALADKQEQEHVMLQVLMRVEQEQRVTEDACRFAEQDAAAQRYAAQVLQEKYEEAVASLAELENRVVLAESTLEATLQYQSGQVIAQPSPQSSHPSSSPVRADQEVTQDLPTRKISLLARPFGLGWRDKIMGKPTNIDEPRDIKPTIEDHSSNTKEKGTNGIQVQDKE